LSFLTDQTAIGKILGHLGLGTPEAEKPPPPAQEVLRVVEHGERWGSAGAVGVIVERQPARDGALRSTT
jgi:hypothetical protein